ncbi:helix-turn-helix domain-containing protein [Paenibacillus hemerocallicola]|uniref:Helix-turn-helix domain-containing protein n=2 Tax=Paenibacillus hemerocallicola TaxID=1172614 RepID=A0A5C4T8V2_9BACL|nr:helix-turn-helix domain-containing protein [Paenibacillus hemerocallicola]
MDYSIGTKPIRVVDLKVDKSKLNLKSLTILDVGHMPGRTIYRKKAIFGNKWALCYITDGTGTYRVNDRDKLPIKKDSLFWVYPGAAFCFGPEPNGYWDEYFFTIEGPRIQEWLNTWMFEPGTVKQTKSDDALMSKIDRIFMLMESGIPGNADRAALLLESLLFDFMMNAQTSPGGGRNEATIKILDDISESIYSPFDAKKLCERHHISFSTLKRNIGKYTGYPLNEYVHRLKIAEAKNILLNTEKTLKEIASCLGYKDVFYFSRLFKKYVGISPNLYRNP